MKPPAKKRARKTPPMPLADVRPFLEALARANPAPKSELAYADPYTLLVAVVLSAQATDVSVNLATRTLYAEAADPAAMVALGVAGVAKHIRRIGLWQGKARNVVALSQLLLERHDGKVPNDRAALEALPGVGRKTANVVLGVAFGAPEGVVVDTHVQRIAQRLGWTRHTEPTEIEEDLCALFPREEWDILSHTLVFHGRRCCFAKKPACAACGVSASCPSAFHAENVGRKAPRTRA
jgi:endonuclease III